MDSWNWILVVFKVFLDLVLCKMKEHFYHYLSMTKHLQLFWHVCNPFQFKTADKGMALDQFLIENVPSQLNSPDKMSIYLLSVSRIQD